MIQNSFIFEKRLLFKELSSPNALEVVDRQGLSKSTDNMFLEDAMKGAKTIDAKIEQLDNFLGKLGTKVVDRGSVLGAAVGAGGLTFWGTEGLLTGALVGTGVGIATLPVAYLASRGIGWVINSTRRDQGLDVGISQMESGISLKQDNIEKAGAWNALKKFVGAESKISIETYARIVEHEIIVDKLISEREKLHGQKLAQWETIKKIRRGWKTRAVGWVTDKFEVNEEQKKFNKIKASLEREKGRIEKRRQDLEEEINKTKDRFEEKTEEYTQQVNESIDAMQSLVGQEIMDKKEWERHILLDPNDLPSSFDVNGVRYDTLDEFISNYPDLESSVRSAMRSSLKESRRLLRKKQRIGKKFGAENFDKFNQKYASEYVLEKRDVVSKIENLSRNVGHSVSLTSVPRELTEKFKNMTAPLTGIVKSRNYDVLTLELKNKSGETFTLELPLKSKIKTEKDFSISIEASGVKKTEKFPMSLLSNMGIKIEDVDVTRSIDEMGKALIPLLGEPRDFSKFTLGLSEKFRDIFVKKFGFRDMSKLSEYKISAKSEQKDGGKIVLECFPDGAGNPGVEIEIPLSSSDKIDQGKNIKIRKVEAGRSITSPLLEEEMKYSDFLRSNATPKVETEKKYKDFEALRSYIMDTKNNNSFIIPKSVPTPVELAYFAGTGSAFILNNLEKLKIVKIGKNIVLSGPEFEITIPETVKPEDKIKVGFTSLTAGVTLKEIEIKAIDLVDFDLHQA